MATGVVWPCLTQLNEPELFDHPKRESGDCPLIVQVWLVLPLVQRLPLPAIMRPLNDPILQVVAPGRVSPDGVRGWRHPHRFEIKAN
jgi:hypothetical protein